MISKAHDADVFKDLFRKFDHYFDSHFFMKKHLTNRQMPDLGQTQ